MTQLCHWEGVPVYDSSMETVVFIVVCRGGDLLVCQRGVNLDPLRLGFRYSDAGVATRSNVTSHL